jgi:alpha-galactosidase
MGSLPYDTCQAEQNDLSSKPGTMPLLRVRLNSEGNPSHKSSKTLIGSYVSSRLKYQSHHEHSGSQSKSLDIITVSQISVTAHLSAFP